jgi:hypothetical protein
MDRSGSDRGRNWMRRRRVLHEFHTDVTDDTHHADLTERGRDDPDL